MARAAELRASAVVVAALWACACHRVEPRRSSAAPPPAMPPRDLPATSFQAAGRTPPTNVTPKLQPSPEAKALSAAFEDVAKAIRPSVVRIDVEGVTTGTAAERDLPDFLKRFFENEGMQPAPQRVHGTASGVVVDDTGDILTNSHVVRDFQKVTVRLPDERSFAARVVGSDPLTDVGVVRIEKPPAGLAAARLGDSDKLRIGEWALAVGSPLGMAQTVTAGIISGVGATGSQFRFESGERIRRYIQTDAKINPGNSGGPLVNLEGEVVGINTLINVGPGGSYGFAIPINQAWHVASVLIKDGRVRYPYIGVSVLTLSRELKGQLERDGEHLPDKGALVTGVSANGPAAAAGLKVGDVITGIDGRSVASADDLVAAISSQRIGGSVKVDDWREGRIRTVDVKVVEYPSQPTAQDNQGQVGLAVQTLTPSIAQSLGLDPKTKGAVVTEVAPGSAAEKAGLGVGDVIREIDRKPIATADDAALAMRSGKGPHLLRVTNAAGTRFVSVPSG